MPVEQSTWLPELQSFGTVGFAARAAKHARRPCHDVRVPVPLAKSRTVRSMACGCSSERDLLKNQAEIPVHGKHPETTSIMRPKEEETQHGPGHSDGSSDAWAE